MVVGDPQLAGKRFQARIGRPQFQAADKSGREQVRINPTDATPMQPPISHKRHDLFV